jgi:hypothetical protein
MSNESLELSSHSNNADSKEHTGKNKNHNTDIICALTYPYLPLKILGKQLTRQYQALNKTCLSMFLFAKSVTNKKLSHHHRNLLVPEL